MNDLIWTLVFVQMAMGAFDTIFHHEGTERLAWRPSQAGELRLHGVRNLLYAVLFTALGWSEPHGAWAAALIALLLVELLITLWDFVEEDRTRKLPATERVLHTLLTLNYGVVLAFLLPLLGGWASLQTALVSAYHGVPSWLCAIAAAGVTVSGIRDLLAADRCKRLQAADPASLCDLPGRRSVLITGGTGFIGRRLVAALVAGGHDVTVLTRKAGNAAALPAPIRIVTGLGQIPDDAKIDAIVNLAGEPIGDGLWTAAKRRRILRSRLRITRDLVRFVARLEHKPEVLVSGSAIGWYGLRGDEPLDESGDGRDCFSRRICTDWEAAAAPVTRHGVRLVLLRIGLVMGAEGGVLSRMLTPFEFGLGGRFGNGRHWMSWIHRDDLVRLILHAISSRRLSGPLNGVAPEPVRNADFSHSLGTALRRPAILPVPAAPLRLALGDFAEELLLSGQRILPAAAQASGFRFRFPQLGPALAEIVGARPRPVEVEAEPARLRAA